MTAARMAAAYEAGRLHMARLSRRAHERDEGVSRVLGDEARRLGRCAAALEVYAAECDQVTLDNATASD